MSIADKITRLQAAKTAIGTAITAKGGTVAAGDGFDDFAADVGTIPAGSGFNWLDYITEANLVNTDLAQYTMDEEVLFDFSNSFLPTTSRIAVSHKGWNDRGTRTIRIKTKPRQYINANFVNSQFITRVVFENPDATGDVDVLWSGDFNGPFSWCANMTEIIGTFDFSNNNWINGLGDGLGSLTHFRVKENTVQMFNFNVSGASALDQDSLVSVANGLGDNAAKTLSLHSTRKTMCDSIMGTVAMDSTNTYHIFTADPSGTVTLSEFITTVKGWTMA